MWIIAGFFLEVEYSLQTTRQTIEDYSLLMQTFVEFDLLPIRMSLNFTCQLLLN
jgi:hypothetical protein